MAWDDVGSSYDAVARKYEARFLDELSAKPRDRELLTTFSESVRAPIVEIGCGPGQVGAFVRARGLRVVGLDLSTEMARLASGRLEGALVADMRSLPLASDRIGGIVAFYSLIHLQRAELGAVLQEFHRVLRPGGRMLLSAHEGTGDLRVDQFLDEPVEVAVTYFELDELVRASETAGFTVTRAERRAPYAGESTVRLYVETTTT